MPKLKFKFAIYLFGIFVLNGYAQNSQSKPNWVDQLPDSEESTFYYRMTYGEDRVLERALSKAFASCLLESSWKLGVKATTSNDLEAISSGVYSDFKLAESSINIPINKVCQYNESLVTKVGYRVYVLWQVSSTGNIQPNFKPFKNCNKKT